MSSSWPRAGSLRTALPARSPTMHVSSRPISATAPLRACAPREPPMAEPLLTVSGLHAGYGATEILRGVDLNVSHGEIVAVLGSNGAGKSTLNLAISGVVRPWRGHVSFETVPIERAKPAAIVARGLIHVPEGRRIF